MLSHTKRYMVITKTWNHKEYSASNDHKPTASYDEFDTYEEVNEFVDMIMELYKDVPRPTGTTRGKWGTVYNVPEGSYFWGFVVLDFDEEKIVSVGGDGDPNYSAYRLVQNCKEQWEYLDNHVRKDNEIPKDYKWDSGEYAGWLRFRWGDGKNAVTNKNFTIHQNVTTDDIMKVTKYSHMFQADALEQYKKDKQKEKKRQKRKSFYKPYVEDDYEFDNSDLIQEQMDADIAAEESKIMFDKAGW